MCSLKKPGNPPTHLREKSSITYTRVLFLRTLARTILNRTDEKETRKGRVKRAHHSTEKERESGGAKEERIRTSNWRGGRGMLQRAQNVAMRSGRARAHGIKVRGKRYLYTGEGERKNEGTRARAGACVPGIRSRARAHTFIPRN